MGCRKNYATAIANEGTRKAFFTLSNKFALIGFAFFYKKCALTCVFRQNSLSKPVIPPPKARRKIFFNPRFVSRKRLRLPVYKKDYLSQSFKRGKPLSFQIASYFSINFAFFNELAFFVQLFSASQTYLNF